MYGNMDYEALTIKGLLHDFQYITANPAWY